MRRHELILVALSIVLAIGVLLGWLDLSQTMHRLPQCTPTIDGKRSGGCSGDWQSIYGRGVLQQRRDPRNAP